MMILQRLTLGCAHSRISLVLLSGFLSFGGGLANGPSGQILLGQEPIPQKQDADAAPAETPASVEEEPEVLEKVAPKDPPKDSPAVPATSDPAEARETKDSQPKPAAQDETSLIDSLKDQVLDQAKAQIPNPVESILERMRNVQDRLTKTETDKATRTEQAQIVSEIDRLIDALKNQKPPPPQSSDSNQNPPPPPMGGKADENQQPRGTPQPKPQNSQKQQGQKSGQEQKKQQGQGEQEQQGQTESVSDKARDSNNSTAKRGRTAEEEAARQRMAKDVWGHLPPGLRQELLNIFSERYIPKYDEQVRRYYEALAEENRPQP